MGITGKDAVKSIQPFHDAFSFHSFRLDTVPYFDEKLRPSVKRATDSRIVHDENYIGFLFLVFLLVELFFLIAFFKTDFTGYATLASAGFATFVAIKSIMNSQKLKAVEFAMKDVSGIFDAKEKVLKKTRTTETDSTDTAEYNYEKSAKETLREVISKSKSIDDPFEKCLFQVSLGLMHDPKHKGAIPQSYEHFDFLHSLTITHLTSLINKIETMCQGIHRKAIDETLVQDYFGSDMAGIVNELLVYLYTRRELHIRRAAEKTKSLEKYMGNADVHGQFYKMKEETHDLLYEYLEYYCYKWYWSNGYRPARFGLFHLRVQQVYHCSLAIFLNRSNGNDFASFMLPYTKAAIDYFNAQSAVSSPAPVP